LALPARQLAAAFADNGIQALRQLRDEIPGTRSPQCLLDLIGGQGWVTQRDIVVNTVVQQDCVLRHVTNHLSPLVDVDVLQGNPVQQDVATLGAQQANCQVDNSGLTRSGRTYQRGQGAGLNL